MGFFIMCTMLLALGILVRVMSSDLETLKGWGEELKGVDSSWNTSDGNPCNWQGIQCGDDGITVTNITLQGMHLKGIIPPSIGRLQSLMELDLSKNSLFSRIPANLSDCKSLTLINLSANRLSGRIPADLHKLRSLVWLDLSVNTLYGSIPEELGNLTELKVLNLAYNDLVGTIPVSFGNLKILEQLSLSQNLLEGYLPQLNWESLASNYLVGEIPENTCAFGELQVLILTNNSFNGTLPSSLRSCHALTNLRVGHNLLTGDVLVAVGKLENLMYFEANDNKLTGQIPVEISGCKSLVLLNLAPNLLVGHIPEELGKVSTLQELHLENNRFSGYIPRGLSQCKVLSFLDLSKNNLVGRIPSDLCSINKLVFLRLQGNALAGEIPASIGDCQQLLELQLCNNRLSGSIPSTIGRLVNLQILLNLSTNDIAGTIPDSIGTLSKLVALDLSHNKLSGRIPSLINMESLVSWDFSYNLLSGPIPQVGSVLNSSSSDYASSYAHNAGLCGGPLSPCDNNNVSKAKPEVISFWEAAGITVACVTVLLAISAAFILAWMHKNSVSAMVDPSPSHTASHIFVRHLTQAVNFDSVKEAIGHKGNLISNMYKVVMPCGLVLAAKKFHSAEKGLAFHYKKIAFDLDKMWRLSHENVMQPIGYIVQENLAVLLYDFVPVCSLGQKLHKVSDHVLLPWSVRYQIAIEAAQGLVFLHHSCHPPMVHLDVNSHNIFLGHHSEVKMGDIEVAKLLDPSKNTGSVSAVAGSFGYIAPEYAFTMQVTIESNVYSFGVILLELLTGRRPVDEIFGDGVDLVRWVRGASARGETREQILDATISTVSFAVRQEMLAVLGVALLCADSSPSKRPRMKKILELLLESRMPAAGDSAVH